MNGIHDMGGMHGFGQVSVEANEPMFHASWERRVLGICYQLIGFGWANVDAFRQAIERIEPVTYLSVGYYGRWLMAAERLSIEAGLLEPGDVDARIDGRAVATPASLPSPRHTPQPGFVRTLDQPPRFNVGQAVRPRVVSPSGHTRLPRYVTGRRGVVHRIQPPCVFPDSNARGNGENPQHLYNVRFEAKELWGPDAEAGTALHIDLFEPYLEAV
ncbi:MAG TPA: nitrile hydratase subunit beta [Candidatus Acidoferrales bacterium]|nr:nitrile hydratase subunit beta [Candidatus Acidoferrales bacterium]